MSLSTLRMKKEEGDDVDKVENEFLVPCGYPGDEEEEKDEDEQDDDKDNDDDLGSDRNDPNESGEDNDDDSGTFRACPEKKFSGTHVDRFPSRLATRFPGRA